MPDPIQYWNRSKHRIEEEKVYGDGGVRFVYENPIGYALGNTVLARHWVSKIAGNYHASPMSKKKIENFVKAFDIQMDEYEDEGFETFNDFFIRKFKPGKRPFREAPDEMSAFAEARYLAFDHFGEDEVYPVKGEYLSAESLLGEQYNASVFEGGPIVIARLCPVDYHRFHFPDSGRYESQYRVKGPLHSVNPVALRKKGNIFSTNERQVSILETENFGKLAYIEVGAMMVGLIIQSHETSDPFKRGDEKGYFLFGASSIVLLGQKGAWKPDPDLLENSGKRLETFIQLGDRIASK